MNQEAKRHNQVKRIDRIAIAVLLVFLGVTVVFSFYHSVLCLLIVFGLRFLYSLFYARIPKTYWALSAFGAALAAYSLFYESGVAVTVFAVAALLECLRVFMIALLNYPSTVRNLETLTQELEKRVQDRTTELKAANSELQRANTKLLELDKLKSAFVSQASHDLRTPLTAIKGSLDNLMIGVAGPLNEKQTRILERAQRSVDRLTFLINDILDLNRIESGREKLQKTDVSLTTMVKGLIQEHKPAADQKSIALDAELNGDEVHAWADPHKMERVIGELIGNAIKYTPEQGRVTVRLSLQDGAPCVMVSDTGVGMSEEESKKIWERFYRTANSQHMAKGSGLGLSIAKELVEMHGGSIRATSEAGRGSTFKITLPPSPVKETAI
ncbi:MAG: hypothetical protein GC154_00085 [bacterium]|nr:hypothetical protein [bacterium]